MCYADNLAGSQEDPGAQGTDLPGHRTAGPGDGQALKGAFCFLTPVAGCWLILQHGIAETCLSTK